MSTKKTIRWILVLAWLVLTIIVSQQKGASSSALSNTVARCLQNLLGKIGVTVEYHSFHASVRQWAHFIMHFVLALLFYRAMALTCGGFKTGLCLSLLFCSLVAIYDELAQYYRPGRAFEAGDIVLNLFGVTCGIILGIITVRRYDS